MRNLSEPTRFPLLSLAYLLQAVVENRVTIVQQRSLLLVLQCPKVSLALLHQQQRLPLLAVARNADEPRPVRLNSLLSKTRWRVFFLSHYDEAVNLLASQQFPP